MAEREAESGAYLVLARKYRPGHFRDLIGQEAMVRTLTNAFATGRIAHAYLLTGVRGVGKTTTARIIAKGLNCTGRGDGPTIDPCGTCPACTAIATDSHQDVVELDAASHTGVDDVREIIESLRYRAVEARYKVYIVDEVHMMSGNAFNAFLKTLEEPPEHVVFLFATTEIRKVPVTVLSRCQRFDLRRIEPETMLAHLEGICAREGIAAEAEALGLVTRAAEGSVRDALSLLDQAMALATDGRPISGEGVRDMLGLADRGRVIDLFEAIMRGDAEGALAELHRQHAQGADAAVVLRDLAELTHWLSVVKIAPARAEDPTVGPDEQARGRDLAGRLPMRVLTRAWQMLLKIIEEVGQAPSALMAAEMGVIRLSHVADLPTPGEALAMLGSGSGSGSGAAAGGGAGRPAGGGQAGGNGAGAARQAGGGAAGQGAGAGGGAGGATAFRAAGAGGQARPRGAGALATQPAPEASEPDTAPAAHAEPDPAPAPARPETVSDEAALVARLTALRDSLNAADEFLAASDLAALVRPVRLREGVMEIALAEGAPADLPGRLGEALTRATGQRWSIVLSRAPGLAPLAERQAEAERALRAEVAAHPHVAAALETFPGARIAAIRPLGTRPRPGDTPDPLAAEDEGAYEGVLLDDDDGEDEED